jgi:peptidyl-tRNA hydrolase, PTH1 family
MHLLVGLGNPGKKYQGNRHNVGFMVIDELVRASNAPPLREKFRGLIGKAVVGTTEVALLKPQTFMNVSGESVRDAMKFYQVEPAQLIVIHDELDVPFGTFRIKVGGGVAGHNGLRSIVQHCGGPDFIRLRVGIGRPAHGTVERFVLSDFSGDESITLSSVLQSAAVALRDVVELGAQPAMNRHHVTVKPAKPSAS